MFNLITTVLRLTARSKCKEKAEFIFGYRMLRKLNSGTSISQRAHIEWCELHETMAGQNAPNYIFDFQGKTKAENDLTMTGTELEPSG